MSQGPGSAKIGLFAAMAGAACAAAAGFFAYAVSETALSAAARGQARSSASLIAAHASDRLQAAMDRAHYYISHSLPQSFARDEGFLALSVLRKPAPGDKDRSWRPAKRWLLSKDALARVDADEFEELDDKFALDLERVSRGEIDVVFAGTEDVPAFLRIAMPYGDRSNGGYAQAIVAETRAESLLSLFVGRGDVLSFMLTSRGRVAVGDFNRFDPSEDLSDLEIVRAAREQEDGEGSVEYRETPTGDAQHAAYARVAAVPGMTVIAQLPHSRITGALRPLIEAMAAAGALFAALFGLAVGWFVSRRAPAIERSATADAPLPVNAPPVAASSPLAKIPDAEVRKSLEQNQVKLAGERTEAAVLHAHLHGIDKLSAKAEPGKLVSLLNAYYRKASQAIESQQGIVDHVHGGSIVAFWGAPVPQEGEIGRAIEAAAAISEAAHELNEALQRENLPACRLGMGLHYGPLAVGELGVAGRLEYSAVGEALEVAALIQQFTDQFGTDFLLTGAAAKRAGSSFVTEQLTPGDEHTPELHELADEDSDEGSGAQAA